MKYDFILFDADNTLFDYNKAEAAALQAAFSCLNIDFHPEYTDQYRQINHALWVKHERFEIGVDDLKVERFRQLFDQLGLDQSAEEIATIYLDKLADNSQLIDGAYEVCSELSKHCKLAIITNGISHTQRRRIGNSPIKDYFDGLFISGEMGCQKPQKEYFDLVLNGLCITDKSRVLVVGDSLSSDIRGANNAGLAACWYNPEGTPLSGDVHAEYIIKHLYELIELVK